MDRMGFVVVVIRRMGMRIYIRGQVLYENHQTNNVFIN